MPSVRRILVVIAVASTTLTASAAAPLEVLPPHPRLLASAADVAAIAHRAEADPLFGAVREATLAAAEKAWSRRTCEYRIPDGKRLLSESRQAIDTVLHTAMAWRLTGDRRHFDRCVKELDAACGLEDWHPPHFLDTAEMATAVAIGLDWLHADLDDASRRRYREALVAKAIEPARREFERRAGWTKVHNNWSQVCAAGIAMACLAAADNAADLAASPWGRCLDVVRSSSRFYEPDGCYPEGPVYWDYGTSYHVLALAMLETLGLPETAPKPLLASVAFMAQARGPTGTMFNFADAKPSPDKAVPARGWLAARAKDPALAADVRRRLAVLADGLVNDGTNDRFFPLHLLWLPHEPKQHADLPLAAAFRGEQPMAALRSSWDDPEALYVAVKGGTPQASHGHMDVGSFVVESGGRRWIHDLGPDDYNLPGYFGDNRWDYFRLNSRSHNVLTIDGSLQNADCPPGTVQLLSRRPPYRARIDASSAYAGRDGGLAPRVIREVSLDPDLRSIHIRDTITGAAGSVRWQVVVDVEPRVEGRRAILVDEGRGLELLLRMTPMTSTDDAPWQVEPATPSDPREKPNDGFWLLSATAAAQADRRFDVEIRPIGHDR